LSDTAERSDIYAANKNLFLTPVIAGVALGKLLGEGCVQDMRKVVEGAIKLKKLARKYAKVSVPCHVWLVVNVDTKQSLGRYDNRKIIARLSFAEEFSARSWAQVSEETIRTLGAHMIETDE